MRKLINVKVTKNPEYYSLWLGSCVDVATKTVYRTKDGNLEFMLVSKEEAELFIPLIGTNIKVEQ